MATKSALITNNQEITLSWLRSHRFSEDAILVLGQTVDRAIDRGVFDILHPSLLLWAMLRWEEKAGVHVLKECGIERWSFERDVELHLQGPKYDEPLLIDCRKVCAVAVSAVEEAHSLGVGWVGTEHLMLALLRLEEGSLRDLFAHHGVCYDSYKQRLVQITVC
jgi:ATP-dependent Clp protease ATP-binding subunit ClpA